MTRKLHKIDFYLLLDYLGIKVDESKGLAYRYSEEGSGILHKIKTQLGNIKKLQNENKCLKGQVARLQSDMVAMRGRVDRLLEDTFFIDRLVALEEYHGVEFVEEATDEEFKQFYRKVK